MKPSVLFVDDEPYLLNGLRRTMQSQRLNWDIYFAVSGETALEIIESKGIDAVVSDMRMPNMDGADLFECIAARFPGVIRIILSGEADREMTYRTLGRSHRFLSKPINPINIIAAINDTLHLKHALSNLISVDDVTNLLLISTPSDIHAELTTAAQNTDSDINTLVAIVRHDPALTAKFLQLVNSAYFGPAQQTWSIPVALRKLGIDLVREILKVEYFMTTAPASHVNARGCDEVALAKAAQDFALSHGSGPEQAELAYNVGLLARVGRHIIFSEPKPAVVTNTMIAAYLTCLIGLPKILYNALTYLTPIEEIYDPQDGARLIFHALEQANPEKSGALKYVG